MTAKQAMTLIVENQNAPALNYAVNYAKAGLCMQENTREFQIQCLYVLSNIAHWKQTKSFSVTKEQIKEAKEALKIEGRKSF